MKNLYKFLRVIAIVAVIGFTVMGCSTGDDGGNNNGGNNNTGGNNNSGGNNSGGGTESITLNSNGQWGWQAIYELGPLLNGNKITQGNTYTFTYSFTSNVSMDYLQLVLIDNGTNGSSNRWVELSGYQKVKENIAANTVVSGTISITATGTATDTTALANRLILQAGTGTINQPTLTFSLSLGNGNNNGGNNNGGGDTAVTFNSVTANGSSSQTTTQLTLTFSQAITGLSAGDITLSGVSGVSKGTLSGSGPTYTLGISGQTAGGTLTVAVSKSGYTISSSSRTVTIYYYSSNGGGGGTTVPSAPTGVSATAQSSSSIRVSWNAVSGATSYKVYYATSSSGTYTLDGTSTTTSFTSTDWGASETGYFRVTAVNSAGESAQSSTVSATTQAAAVARETRLDQPIFGTCSISGSSAVFNWTLKTTGTTTTGLYDYVAPTSIKIEVYAEGTSWYTITTLTGTARTYTLSNWETWSYYVGTSQRVSLRVTCIRSGNTETSAIMSYWKSTSGSTSTWVPTY